MRFGSLQEIVDEHIHDGQSAALEGFTHLIPFAAGHEILRQNVSVDTIRAATGWPLVVANTVDVVAAPTAEELRVLRDLHKRMKIAHASDALQWRKTRVRR